MYVSIGGDMAVRDRSVIGIFDLDGCSRSKKTMEYLENMERSGVLLNVTEDVPKTFLVTEEYGMEKVLFTQLSAATLEKRMDSTYGDLPPGEGQPPAATVNAAIQAQHIDPTT